MSAGVRRRGSRGPFVLPAVDRDRWSRPCIVHLVRAANGQAPYRTFIDALRRCPAGVDCDLVLAMKGFERRWEAEPYLEWARDLSPEPLFFDDLGLDLGVYLAAAARLRRGRYCFVNSYSLPLADGWLAKLDAALDRSGVGLVGATGSWGSTRSWVAYSLNLPSAYRGVLPPRRVAREQFLGVELDRAGIERRSRTHSVRARLRSLRQLRQHVFAFESFPAHHLRTNAFMVSHDTLRALRLHVIRDKMDAYLLENGRDSITRQVQRMGLRTLVVDRAGVVYDYEQWDRSRTFWQGDQEGLLVADNQTFSYTHGDRARRALLSGFAWGRSAEPSLPGRSAQPTTLPGRDAPEDPGTQP